MATVVLRRGRAKPLWAGHPWVYAESVERVEGGPADGDLVEVRDEAGRFVARHLREFPGPGLRVEDHARDRDGLVAGEIHDEVDRQPPTDVAEEHSEAAPVGRHPIEERGLRVRLWRHRA